MATLLPRLAAVLLVTHEPEEAMRMADEIALMRDGHIVQRGAPYNIYNAPADKAAVASLEAAYNAAVSAEEDLAGKFNSAIRAYKEANPS